MMLQSKSEFAAHIGVVPSRITKMIQDGIIGADALAGEGRSARIIVERAVEQIRTRRHVGQALGNGIETLLDAPAATDSKPATDDTAALIQLERLDQERRKNRQAERNEAVANGRLVPGEELQRQVGKSSQTVMNWAVGLAPDIADAIAAQFKLPQRDVLHLVRNVMRDRRAAIAQDLKLAAAEMPETVETVI